MVPIIIYLSLIGRNRRSILGRGMTIALCKQTSDRRIHTARTRGETREIDPETDIETAMNPQTNGHEAVTRKRQKKKHAYRLVKRPSCCHILFLFLVSLLGVGTEEIRNKQSWH